MANKGANQQLNWYLGQNTVYFHLQYPLPVVKCTQPNRQYQCSLPYPDVIQGLGGSPNQKAERVANAIAYYFFVQNEDSQAAQEAYANAVDFFKWQLSTGHQCIGNQDEALTESHAPIWWRAIMSLRITSYALATTGASWGKQYPDLQPWVLDWIQFQISLCSLGVVPTGANAGKVVLPGSRWSYLDGNPAGGTCCGPSTECVEGNLTDQVNNVVYQRVTTGSTPWSLGPQWYTLDPEKLDLVGAVLAQQVLDQKTIGFGNANVSKLPQLRSELKVYRQKDGHWACFPQSMPCAVKPALSAWAIYSQNQMCMSSTVGSSPLLPPLPEPTVVQAVPLGTEDCDSSETS